MEFIYSDHEKGTLPAEPLRPLLKDGPVYTVVELIQTDEFRVLRGIVLADIKEDFTLLGFVTSIFVFRCESREVLLRLWEYFIFDLN